MSSPASNVHAADWNRCALLVRKSREHAIDLSRREKQLATLKIQACIARAAFPSAWKEHQGAWEAQVEPEIRQTEEAIAAIRQTNSSNNALQIQQSIDDTVSPPKIPPGTGSLLMIVHQWVAKTRTADSKCIAKSNIAGMSPRQQRSVYLKCFAATACSSETAAVEKCKETRAKSSEKEPKDLNDHKCHLDRARLRVCRTTALRILQVLNEQLIPEEPVAIARELQTEILTEELKEIAKSVENFTR